MPAIRTVTEVHPDGSLRYEAKCDCGYTSGGNSPGLAQKSTEAHILYHLAEAARENLVGFGVSYEDPARFNCGLPKAEDTVEHRRVHNTFCNPADRFGWEGVITDAVVEDEHVLLVSEDGYSCRLYGPGNLTVFG